MTTFTRRLRVLLVEDRPQDAELTLAELRRSGFEVVHRRVETEADYLASLKEQFDVILADYCLPQFDAARALQLLHEQGLDIPFIIVSGTIGEDVAVNAMRQGATDYLLKDRLARLGQVIKRGLEQKRLRLEKRRAEDKYRLIFEHAAEGIAQSTKGGRFLSVNLALARMLGYDTPAELIKSVTDIGRQLYVDPKQRAEFMRRINASGVERGFETEVYRKDGSRIWMRMNARAARDDAGKLLYYDAFIEDITARKQAEAALRESEELFRKLSESSPLGIALMDNDGACTYSNPRCRSIFGVTPKGTMGDGWARWLHPDDRSPILEEWRVTARGGSEFSREFRLRLRDGTVRWVRLWRSPMRGDQGELRGHVATAEDITEFKQIQQALQRSERHFRSLIENAEDLITIVASDGTIRYQSPSSERVLGYRPDQLVNRSAFETIHPEDAPKVVAALARALQFPDWPTSVEFRFRHANGSWRVLESIGKRLDDGGEESVVVNSRDVTERKQLEEQFRQAQKLEAIGQLAGGVAHDFNNILTIIEGHAVLAQSYEDVRPEVLDSAQQICLAAERAAHLTRQLLTFSRKQAILPQSLNLNELVASTSGMLQRTLGEHIALEVRYSPTAARVYADAGMMDQILLNLAVNSRDAMPKGGQLRIGTDVVAIDSDYVQHNPEATAGQFVRLTVTDTGCGIPSENLPRIFEPFFTTKEVGKGTGLGLATVYGVVKQHHGWIKVVSEVGKGTTFDIFLPHIIEEKERTREKPGEKKIRGGTETILVVEDEPAVRVLVVSFLERNGYRVLEAVSGQDARNLWQAHRRDIKLLLTDVVMPDGLTGRELAEELQAERPDLKVIFTSGYSAEVVGSDFAMKEGVNFLQKPYHPYILAETVRTCLDS
jgi:PAS domain S-box-containing protein